jgi:hypothetical protein
MTEPGELPHLELLGVNKVTDLASDSEVIATVYKAGSGLYIEALPPQSLTCLKPPDQVGCPVSRVFYGYANVTPEQQADAEWNYRGPDLDRNTILVMGFLASVTVRDHRRDITSEQIWFMVNKLYRSPNRGRVVELHSEQYFYTTGTTTNAQVVAISQGEQTPRAARITWTGLATYGSGGPTNVDDMYVTGQANLSVSPLPLRGDEYFVRQTR